MSTEASLPWPDRWFQRFMKAGRDSPLAGIPDDTVLDFPEYPHNPVILPNTRLFDSPEELRNAAPSKLSGHSTSPYLDRGWGISHELEHAAAARAVGYTKILYGLYHNPEAGPGEEAIRLFMWSGAPSRPVTKLAIATVTAAPALLSPGDLETLRAMGYRGAADVAARVRELALRTGIRLPVPASLATGKGLQRKALRSLEFPVANPLDEGAQRPPTSSRAPTSRRRASWVSRSRGRLGPH